MGMMASGKSTVGRLVAARLGLPLLDNDHLLEARYGADAAHIQAATDQAELHRREAEVLLEALDRPDPAVITAAASVVEDTSVRAALERHDVVWLDADPEVLARRVLAGDDHRPGRGPDIALLLRDQEHERRPLFAEVADVVVDTSARSPEDAAAEVLAALSRT